MTSRDRARTARSTPRARGPALAWAVGILILLGCSTPYSLRLSDVDETPHSKDQRDAFALFLVRDAQIYARETLINDRRRERAYLERALTASETQTFTPQLARELARVSALTADLGIAFDPAKGLASRQAAETAGLQQQVDAAKLRLELVDLQRRMALLETGERSPGVDPVTAPPRQNPSDLAPTPPSTERLISRLNAQIAQVMELLKADIPLAKPTPLTPNPDEVYLDRKALRDRIRADLAEANLDDMHDVNGNSLFRFQFGVTVAPGEKKAKYGVAHLTVEPPRMTSREVEATYHAWLRHLTYRLNETAADDRDQSLPDRRLQLLAASSKMFDIARLYMSPLSDSLFDRDECTALTNPVQAQANGCVIVYLAVPPGVAKDVEGPFPGGIDLLLQERVDRGLYGSLGAENGKAYEKKAYWPLVVRLLDRFLTEEKKAEGTQSGGTGPEAKSRWTRIGEITLCGDPPLRDRAAAGLYGEEIQALALSEKDCDTLLEPGSEPSPRTTSSDEQKSGNTPANGTSGSASATTAPPSGPSASGTASSAPKPSAKSECDPPNRTAPKSMAAQQRLFEQGLKVASALRVPYGKLLSGKDQSLSVSTDGRRNVEEAVTALAKRAAAAEAKILALLLGLAADEDVDALLPDRAARAYAELLDRQAAVVAAAAEGALARRDLGDKVRARALARVEQFQSGVQFAREYARKCPPPASDKQKAGTTDEGLRRFKSALFTRDVEAYRWIPRGGSYVYAVAPTEKTQIVSSVASAAQSLQLALAASGALPNAGVSAEGGLGYAQNAVGKVQALERIPSVVGFADRSRRSGIEPDQRRAEFGWVFGPRVRLDPAHRTFLGYPSTPQLVLEQPLSNYAVSADVVLPGWWPSVVFVSKNAWVGHWYSGATAEVIDKGVTGVPFQLPKAVNRADYDGLTSYVSQLTNGRPLQITRIHRIEPPSVSLCNTGKVTFQIYGANLWRGTQANLMGAQALPDQIEILPDMEGVTATFDLATLRSRFVPHGDRRVTIWTRDGFDTAPVVVTGQPKGAECEDAWVSPKTPASGPRIAAVTPSVLSVCYGKPTLTAETFELWPTPPNRSASEVSAADPKGSANGNKGSGAAEVFATLGGESATVALQATGAKGLGLAVLRLSVDKPVKEIAQGLTELPLLIVGKDGRTASTTIKIAGDPKACNAVSQPDPLAVTITSARSNNSETVSACDGPVVVQVAGTNLDKVAKAELLGRSGPPNAIGSSAKATSFTLDLPGFEPGKAPPEVAILRMFDAKDKNVAEHAFKMTACEKPKS